MSEFDSSVMLAQALTEKHREAALASLAAAGIELAAWDPDTVKDLGKTSLVAAEVFNRGTDLMYGSGIHLGPVLDFDFIKPAFSGVPLSYFDYFETEGGNAFEHYIDSPVRILRLKLFDNPNGQGHKSQGDILITPDSPAIGVDDYYQNRIENLFPRMWEGIDSQMVSKIRRHFGSESIEVLSEESCLAIIHAIKNTPATLPNKSGL
jgi:hypothetical protein